MRWFSRKRETSPAGDIGRPSVTARGRAGRGLVTAFAALLSAVPVASPALAAAPEVVQQENFDQAFTVPAGALCGVEVTFHEVGTGKLTEFSDNDGNLVRATIHVGATTTITSEYGQVVNRWRQNGILDPETDTATWSGNSFNLHAGAGGILANVSGHWVEDLLTGAVTVVGGPHEDPNVDPDVLAAVCAELEP